MSPAMPSKHLNLGKCSGLVEPLVKEQILLTGKDGLGKTGLVIFPLLVSQRGALFKINGKIPPGSREKLTQRPLLEAKACLGDRLLLLIILSVRRHQTRELLSLDAVDASEHSFEAFWDFSNDVSFSEISASSSCRAGVMPLTVTI